MRRPSELLYEFDPDWYVSEYADVRNAEVDPWKHYLRHGVYEGRAPRDMSTVAAFRDAEDQRSFKNLKIAMVNLEFITERIWASSEILLKAKNLNHLPAVRSILDSELGDPAFAHMMQPWQTVLVFQSWLSLGEPERARLTLKTGRSNFPNDPNYDFAAANLAENPKLWRKAIAPVFRAASLKVPQVETLSFADLETGAYSWPRSRGPLVGVIMPVLNARTTLPLALNSVLGQSHRALEVLVVDNGSTDNSQDYVMMIAKADSRVRLVDGSADPGAYAARNLGLSKSAGDLITVHDADDWSHPNKIALQVKALRRAEVVASASSWVRADSRLRFDIWHGGRGYLHRNVSSLLLKRAVVDQLGYWDRVRVGADTEYYDRICAVFGSEAIAQVCPNVALSFGRIAEGSLTRSRGMGLYGRGLQLRRQYSDSYMAWHQHNKPALKMSQFPKARPFPVPGDLMLDGAG